MKINVPGSGIYDLETLILDLNGTLAIRGKLIKGVKDRIQKIKKLGLKVVLFSGDTRGNADKISKDFNIELVTTKTSAEKLKALKKLNPNRCVAIGNGLIDAKYLKAARLGIAVVQAEGAHTQAILAADIRMLSVNDALDLLLNEKTFISTLRQ